MFADAHTQFFTTAMCFCETKPGFFYDPVCRSVDFTSGAVVLCNNLHAVRTSICS